MPHDPDRIARLIREGRKVEAVKALREATGMDLQRAKEEVERLSEGLDDPEARRDLDRLKGSDSGLSDEVLGLWQRGKKIDAIALHRRQTGMGLKESKEQLEAATGTRTGGCLPSVVLSVLLVLLLLFSIP